MTVRTQGPVVINGLLTMLTSLRTIRMNPPALKFSLPAPNIMLMRFTFTDSSVAMDAPIGMLLACLESPESSKIAAHDLFLPARLYLAVRINLRMASAQAAQAAALAAALVCSVLL